MPLGSFEGKRPTVHPTAFIAPTAVLVGDVTVEENASVWHNAVLRGDLSPIIVRRGANVQDGAVVHVTPGTEIPEGMLAVGVPAKVKGPLAGTPAERWVQVNLSGYQALAQRHRLGVTLV